MQFMRILPVIAALASLSVLAACGDREPERAEGGAAAGAATGAAVGVVGGPVGVAGGALIGGAVGGATGAATKPGDVNLGAPPWHDNTATGQEAATHMAN
jgi:phage tail tape-measure protein